MVPLDRALVSSHRLSIVAMSLSAAVWPQFANLRGGVSTSVWRGRGKSVMEALIGHW